MQPIAINIELIESLINDWNNYKSQREFHKMVEYLENFHCIAIDKQKFDNSLWLKEYREFRKRVTNDNILKMIDDLIGPKNQKYKIVKVDSTLDLLIEIAKKTPEKIGLDKKSKQIGSVNLYDLKSFNSNHFDVQNYLFRIPKIITINPGDRFDDIRLFGPYIRDANKLEFCDLYLFKNIKAKGETIFLMDLIKISKSLKQIIIHCDLNPMNILQKEFVKEIKSKFKDQISLQFVKYNPPTIDVNHDRFIIIDDSKYSIRFTTSFNNLRLSSRGELIAKDSFLIEFSAGRKYIDTDIRKNKPK